MPDSPRRRLRDELTAHPWEGEIWPTLGQAIDAFVGECRSEGDPPERVLLKLKDVMLDARAGHAGQRLQSVPEQRLKERLVAHCIACYYRAEPDQPDS